MIPSPLPTPIRHDRLRRLARPYGVRTEGASVCQGHDAPISFLDEWVYKRPSMSLVLGPRGGGKSFLRAFATHVDCLQFDRHAAKILGGSEAQSEQIYNALKGFGSIAFAESDLMPDLTATRARYSTGSEVSYIPASPKSVRGPHVPSLCLDEIDEMDDDVRDSSLGMCMEMHGISAAVSMTSTWHRVGGPMEGLLERGRAGEFPTFTFCAFEVLQHCPASRSGPRIDGPDLYAGCPECPLRPWCHADVRPHPDTGTPEPKAKRSAGHYAIDSLIQKARVVSSRVFEADYLCSGPKADGLWFPHFNATDHLGDDAEYDPALPVDVAIDCGTSRYTSATFFQVRERPDGTHLANVFGEYLGVDVVSEGNARAILDLADRLCNGRIDRVRLDPASRARTSIGPAAYGEYERVFGARRLAGWPMRTVRDSLDLLDGFLRPASGGTNLRIHPRCVEHVRALQTFRRAKSGPVYLDSPMPEQHPIEDFVDSLKGGLCDRFPSGVRPPSSLPRVHPGRFL